MQRLHTGRFVEAYRLEVIAEKRAVVLPQESQPVIDVAFVGLERHGDPPLLRRAVLVRVQRQLTGDRGQHLPGDRRLIGVQPGFLEERLVVVQGDVAERKGHGPALALVAGRLPGFVPDVGAGQAGISCDEVVQADERAGIGQL
ncbi:MAG: hypothetical protein IPO15_15325 [Anaerolineae bacterium]|nr:hypothetical protein [Anaerolineae bacterium]